MTKNDAVTAAVEAAKSSPIVKAADAIGRALVPEFNVYAADCCGRFYEKSCATLGDAKAHAVEVRATHPKAFVDVERPSNIDLGCYNGLTLEERDFLEAPPCEVPAETFCDECGSVPCSCHLCSSCGEAMAGHHSSYRCLLCDPLHTVDCCCDECTDTSGPDTREEARGEA